MKRLTFMLLLLTSLSFDILFTTANFPTDHQQRVSENQVVARGKGFVIQAKDFVEYKTHVKTMLETAGRPFDTSNNDLIKEMIQRELLKSCPVSCVKTDGPGNIK